MERCTVVLSIGEVPLVRRVNDAEYIILLVRGWWWCTNTKNKVPHERWMGKGQFERRSTHQRRRRGRAMRGIVEPRRAGQGRVELPCLQLDTGGQDTGPCPERDGPGARSGWRCKPGERHWSRTRCRSANSSTPSSASSLRAFQGADNHLPASSTRRAIASISGKPV